jgi:hypothetical protein
MAAPNVPIAKPFKNVFSTTVTADWDVNSNPNTVEYFVQLSSDPAFIFNVQSSGWSTTVGYAFTLLQGNVTYYGRVKARNPSLEETAYVSLSSILTPLGPDTVKTIHVYNLLAERGFLIKWEPGLETNLVNYKVYRSSSPTDFSSFSFIATTPANVTSYIDNVPFSFGIVYYYIVTAIDNGGNESSLDKTTPVQDNTFHSFEEQPFPTTISTTDFVDDETPIGLVNTVNTLFTTLHIYKPGTLEVYLNGVRQHRGLDFTEGPLSQQFVFLDPPDTGGIVRVDYIKF